MASPDNHRINRQPIDLRLDRVVASQPELGPSVPDGGYGWIILFTTMVLQLVLPSIIVAYGIFMLFYRLEMGGPTKNLYLWDNRLLPAPLSLIVVWTLSDPWSRKLVRNSTWPRLVATSGLCLTCAGLLVTWLSIKHRGDMMGFIMAGAISGMGVSLTIQQGEILLKQYFRLKLPIILSLLQATKTVGYVFTPYILGELLVQQGILRVLVLYQTLVLQGMMMVLAYKKPLYLKSKRRPYNLIQNVSDDEEDIYPKTELQQTVLSYNAQNNNATTTNSTGPAPYGGAGPPTPTTPTTSSPSTEEYSLESVSANVDHQQQQMRHKTLHDSFAEDFQADLDRIENFNDIPRPLFTDVSIHNDNNTYSYDNADVMSNVSSQLVFMQPLERRSFFSCRQTMDTLAYATFYKSLLLHITTQSSSFIFWTIFPSYLYYEIDSLKISQAAVFVSCVAAGSLLFSVSSTCVNIKGKTRAILLSMFSFLGAAGYGAIVTSETYTWIIFGGLHVVLSITALQNLAATEKKVSTPAYENKDILLSIFTAIFMVFIFAFNISYTTCFRIMSLLHFINGAVWFSNFIFKKIKKYMVMQPSPISTIPQNNTNRE